MPSVSSLLLKIPDEFKPLAALGIGGLILSILVVFHGLGLHRILAHFKRTEVGLEMGRPHLVRARFFFGWAVFQMLSLHIAEIVVWAYALIWLGLIVHPTDAIYFCANAYTTLGYGTVDLGAKWRNISPIIAISGLFTFAWTASAMVGMVSSFLKVVEQLERERLQQKVLRTDAEKAEWDVIRNERDAEVVERQAAMERAIGKPFLERRKIRKEEKLKEEQMRAAARAEMAKIRKDECAQEDKLGATPLDDTEAKK